MVGRAYLNIDAGQRCQTALAGRLRLGFEAGGLGELAEEVGVPLQADEHGDSESVVGVDHEGAGDIGDGGSVGGTHARGREEVGCELPPAERCLELPSLHGQQEEARVRAMRAGKGQDVIEWRSLGASGGVEGFGPEVGFEVELCSQRLAGCEPHLVGGRTRRHDGGHRDEEFAEVGPCARYTILDTDLNLVASGLEPVEGLSQERVGLAVPLHRAVGAIGGEAGLEPRLLYLNIGRAQPHRSDLTCKGDLAEGVERLNRLGLEAIVGVGVAEEVVEQVGFVAGVGRGIAGVAEVDGWYRREGGEDIDARKAGPARLVGAGGGLCPLRAFAADERMRVGGLEHLLQRNDRARFGGGGRSPQNGDGRQRYGKERWRPTGRCGGEPPHGGITRPSCRGGRRRWHHPRHGGCEARRTQDAAGRSAWREQSCAPWARAR